MADIKNQVQNIDPNVSARDIQNFLGESDTIYEAINVISKRARQLAVEIKQELHQKLEEFAVTTDALEEVNENKEQIEISKFYEKMPNPVIIATNEYLDGELFYRYRDNNRRRDRDYDELR